MKQIRLIIDSTDGESGINIKSKNFKDVIFTLNNVSSNRFFMDVMVKVAMFLNGFDRSLIIIANDREKMAELACILKSISSLKSQAELNIFTQDYVMFPTRDHKFEISISEYKKPDEETEISLYRYAYMDNYTPFDFGPEASEIIIMLHNAIHEANEQNYSDLPTVKGMKYYSRENWRNEYTLVQAIPFKGGSAMILCDLRDPKNNTVVVESCEFTENPCPTKLYDSEFFITREGAINGAIKKKEEAFIYLKDRKEDILEEFKKQ